MHVSLRYLSDAWEYTWCVCVWLWMGRSVGLWGKTLKFGVFLSSDSDCKILNEGVHSVIVILRHPGATVSHFSQMHFCK